MGDRGNIFFVDQRDEEEGTCAGIYMYTHWAGYDLPQILQEGLKRGRSRWDDPQYLPRILFCEMVKDDIEGERCYGHFGSRTYMRMWEQKRHLYHVTYESRI